MSINSTRRPSLTSSTTERPSSTVVVIGAGPYGLSIAAHLQQQGIEARVFGRPMGSWRDHMPSGMFLKSTQSASNLYAPVPGFTIADFCKHIGLRPLTDSHPVPIELFINYGLWFQEKLVPRVERVKVAALRRTDEDFDVILETGEEIRSQTVVVASGQLDFAYVPPQLTTLNGQLPSATGLVSHSSQHREFSTLVGTEVAVVGAGQSALECAALLHESGAKVHLIVRGSRLLFGLPPSEAGGPHLNPLVKPSSPLGPGWSLFTVNHMPVMIRYLPHQLRQYLVRSLLGPSGAWWLKNRVVGQFDIRTEDSLVEASLDGNRVVLRLVNSAGRTSELTVDHVLSGTGYEVNLDAIGFLEPDLRASLKRTAGSPRLSATFESSVRGLFFTGLLAAATFGPLLRFVCGTGFAAPRLSAGVCRRIRSLQRA